MKYRFLTQFAPLYFVRYRLHATKLLLLDNVESSYFFFFCVVILHFQKQRRTTRYYLKKLIEHRTISRRFEPAVSFHRKNYLYTLSLFFFSISSCKLPIISCCFRSHWKRIKSSKQFRSLYISHVSVFLRRMYSAREATGA